MAFKEDNYEHVKGALSQDLLKFLKINYDIYEASGYIHNPPTENNPYPFGDVQTPTSFAFYGSLPGDSLLIYLKPLLEKITEEKLIETYSYMRIYYTDSELKRHIDRPSCELSATMCIKKGSKDWPIYFEKQNGETVEVEMNEGDLVVYRGCVLPHWRNKYDGDRHYQVFIHFVTKDGPFGEEYRYDKRKFLWQPSVNQK
jgi:hypothetical protein